ncbi:hypothetical protein KAH37_02045, partial [bacterium]|nr:hypothetical protein [bacterium]
MKKNRTKRYQVVTFLLKCIGMTPFLLFAFAVSAEIHGNMPGGEPSLTFEDHGLEYFVMFNSFLDDTITFYGETSANPQGDVCLSTSSFTLTEKHLPNDAIVEKAYLIWMGAVAPDQLDKPTDNEVTLSFYNKHTKKVKAGDVGKLLTDAPSFEFEGIKFVDDVEIGCSNTFDGSTVQAEVGYFTYRV